MKIIKVKYKNTFKDIFVDDKNYDFLIKFKWFIAKGRKTFYVKRFLYWDNLRETNISETMHQMIYPNYKIIDHIDGNGLNNQECNLRGATNGLNLANRDKNKNNTSGYKGVCLRKNLKKNPYSAQIRVNRKTIFLGYFSNSIDAAKAYDKAAIKYFKEFAWLNFSDER